MRQESIPLTSIRGFAALWVVAMHFDYNMVAMGYNLWPGLAHYGYVGVDIFFILSGFILTAVYRGLEWRGVAAFLTRRVFRVYPLHVAVLAGMLALWLDHYFRFGAQDPTQRLSWLPICALLLQPFVYHRLMWNAVSWSISMELVCYMLFPIAIMRLRHAAWPILLAMIVALAVAEHHIQIYDIYIWGDGAIARGLTGFGLGMAIRLLSERLPVPSALVTSLVEVAAVAGIVTAASTGEGQYVTLFAAVLILCLSYERGIVARGLSARLCFWLGKISFSLYLLHEEMVGVIWAHFPATRLPFGHRIDGYVWTLGVLAFVLATATVTWYCIEEPCRRFGGRLARRIERYDATKTPRLRSAAPAPLPSPEIMEPAGERPVAG